ncbi:hypothetical protein LTS08_003438 [Lithohypha guttulata]|nr:hypothetical protein LTS08_003438 [Lithohypha guttulata]
MCFPGLFARLAPSTTDLESGQAKTTGPEHKANGSSPYGMAPNSLPYTHNVEVQKALMEFRHFVGIHHDPDLAAGRAVANLGIYQRVIKQERKYKQWCRASAWLTYAALVLQLVFATALTALGVGDGPRSAVTVLGAINIIIAGFLVYLKGSELPNRLKYQKEQLSQIREYIEQREREFARGDLDVDLRAEVATIEDVYELLRRDIETNTPDAYVSRIKESAAIAATQLDRQTRRATRELDSRISYVDEKFNSAYREHGRKFSEPRLGASARYNETHSSNGDRPNRVTHGWEAQPTQERLVVEKRYRHTRRHTDDSLRGMGLATDLRRADSDKWHSNSQRDVRSRTQEADLDRHPSNRQAPINSTEQINNESLTTQAQFDGPGRQVLPSSKDATSEFTVHPEDGRRGIELRLREAETQIKPPEDDIMSKAKNVAQRVLEFTQHRRQYSP